MFSKIAMSLLLAFPCFIEASAAEKNLHPAYNLMPQMEINPYSVVVKKKKNNAPERVWWHEVKENKSRWWSILPFVTSWKFMGFNDLPGLVRFEHDSFKEIFNTYFETKKEEWNQEAVQAALDNDKEPSYLKDFSNLVEPILENFIESKKLETQTKASLTKHAYSLLLTMNGYNNAAGSAAGSAARFAAGDAAWDAAGDAAWDAAWDAAGFAAGSAALDAARSAAGFAAGFAAGDAAGSAAGFAARSAAKEGKSTQEIGRVAYRIAEKDSQLYFLKNFSSITEKTYMAAFEKMTENPTINIFESSDSWNAFKSRYFPNIRADAEHFLKPWITQLDKIVAEIEALES